MNQYRNPEWWDPSYDSAWERVKAAFKRDWDQTKHDFGGKQPDTDQDVDDTVAQAAGKQPIPPRGIQTYEEAEHAYRFGYGARKRYGRKYSAWDDRLEARLEQDWRDTAPEYEWNRFRGAVRRGWDFDGE
jgi:hypothetical protein